jgi:hypothetical protein
VGPKESFMKLSVPVGILALWFGLHGFAQQVSPASQAPGKVLQQKSTNQPPGMRFTESEETRLKKEFLGKISTLVAAKDFAELDALANDLRKSKAETASGVWHLTMFYGVLTFNVRDVNKQSEQAWMERQIFLNKWVQTKADSITARVALASFWMNYAWEARGTGYADTVKDGGWEMFDSRLTKAEQVLGEARKLESKCPMWWDVMQSVALGRAWKLEDYDKIFNEAVKFEPGYTQYYNGKAWYLLPRWFGKEGDWQKFAAEAADKVGGEAGDVLYARIGWRMHQRIYYKGSFLRETSYLWPRMKKGLQSIAQKYPRSLPPASELAYLAYQAEDRDCAKPIFTKMGLLVDTGTWHRDVDGFMRARTWALGQ